MILRLNPLRQRYFWGCSEFPACRGSIDAYPDGLPRNIAPHKEDVAGHILRLKDRAIEFLDEERAAGRMDYDTEMVLWAMVLDADNLLALGRARATMRGEPILLNVERVAKIRREIAAKGIVPL